MVPAARNPTSRNKTIMCGRVVSNETAPIAHSQTSKKDPRMKPKYTKLLNKYIELHDGLST